MQPDDFDNWTPEQQVHGTETPFEDNELKSNP